MNLVGRFFVVFSLGSFLMSAYGAPTETYKDCIANNNIGAGARIIMVNSPSSENRSKDPRLKGWIILNGIISHNKNIVYFNGKPIDLKALRVERRTYNLHNLRKRYALEVRNQSRGAFPEELVHEFRPGIKIIGAPIEHAELQVKIKSDDPSKVVEDIKTDNDTLSISTQYKDQDTMALVKYRLRVPQGVYVKSSQCNYGDILVRNVKGRVGVLSSDQGTATQQNF